MSAISARWQRLGDRAEPHLRSTLFTTFAIGGYVGLMAALVTVPVMVADLGSAAWLGRVGPDQALHLTIAGRAALGAIAAIAFCLSVMAGGFAKEAFRRDRAAIGNGVLLVLGVLFAFPVIMTVRAVVETANKVASAPVGDNVAAAGVLLFWVLMVNNAAKPIWDEARDRVGTWIGGRIDRFSTWFGEGDAPADGNGAAR